jgi:ketosteroid isomerase-like protein
MMDLGKLVRNWFAAWADRDFDALTAMYDPEAEYVRPEGTLKGVRAIIAYRKQVAEAFPDEVAHVEAVLVSPEAVTVQWTQSATHTGPMTTRFGVVEPTGKAFKDLRVVDIFRFRSDKIVSQYQYYDLLALLRQVGWIEVTPAGTTGPGR